MNTEGIDPKVLDSIYNEAILFVVVFFSMSVISWIWSRRNAKKYEIDNPLEERRKAKKDAFKKEIRIIHTKGKEFKDRRLNELVNMLRDDILYKDEFELLKKNLEVKED
ncbi:hypothetical protein [Sulfurimonas sp.]|uniref:hypothetical protein n=1 Tax=Sulfurimonas sp. TaxID=2022749 RepID=UPI002B475DE5|nr:hypothetical protein [Sulfurimonas sp.]